MTKISMKNTKAEILRELEGAVETIAMLENKFLEPVPNKNTTVVIPYIAKFAQGNELQLALRGWEKHFKEDFNVVIIGDSEPWMSDLVNVIECERVGNNPPIDIAHKMLLAIESDLVSRKFIWANDDQYLVSPCRLIDFEYLKCDGKLSDHEFPANLYGKNKKLTLDRLRKSEKREWDYSTHTPFVFEKAKLKNLIVDLELTKNARLISSLYYNWYWPEYVPMKLNLDADNIKVGVYRQGANLKRLKQLIPKKKLVSNSQSGWSDAFSKIMNSIHSEKCQFEK